MVYSPENNYKMPLNRCFPCLQFQNEEVITKLDCSNTILTDVFPDVWQYERTLEELYLTSTRINNLPPQLFYCQSLRILVVNNNSLESIPNAIGSLRQLHYLNLSRNLISSVPDNIKTCKNLTYLDLSCNSLQRLPDAITCLISLQELLLNETYLEFLPANFGRLVNLKILELRLNNLITLPKSMARLFNLQRIDIGGNEFTELPNVIGELKQLRELWIDFNQIRHISPNIAKLRELQHFESNGNLIDSLPNEICHWRNIEVLSICTNNLESLPFSMGMMKSLVTFKCESNNLRELPDSISNLENLEELVLSHNKLLRLPATIGMLRKLRFLFVDDNELRGLPQEICSCSNLSVLSISRNRITQLPQNIGHLTKLKVLNLVNNYIATLPVSVLSLVNLTSLWISDNQSQPLVPLQYVDTSADTQLTCFMLPQIGLRINRMQEEYNDVANDYQQHEDQEYNCQAIEQHQGEEYATNVIASPSRRICFAEHATILTDAIPPNELSASSDVVSDTNNSRATATSIDEQLGARLMRSPTPYPKELRLMAKYVRNGKKLSQKPLEVVNVKESRVMLNISNVNNLENNDVQSHIHIPATTLSSESDVHAGTSQTQSHKQQLYSIIPQQHQKANQIIYPLQQSVQYNQMSYHPHYQQISEPNRDQNSPALQQFYATYFVPSSSSHLNTLLAGNSITQNYEIINKPPEQHDNILSDCYGNSNNAQIMSEPPPYHIARVFTKKTPEDLSNYETIRNQNHHQHLQQQPHQKTDTQPYLQDIIEQKIPERRLQVQPNDVTAINNEIISVEFNNSFKRNTKNPEVDMSLSDTTTSFDHENNFLNDSSISSRQNPSDTTYTMPNLQLQQLNGSLSQLSICSTSSTGVNNFKSALSNSGGKCTSKTTPWLFGVHKNPTVKQINIKWEYHVGFEIGGLPNKGGIFIISTVPNTNASRLLYVNDKLLEIDGCDVTNMNVNDAKRIISNARSVINIMLSRK